MTRTEFLREQTVSGANKCARVPFPTTSVENEPCGIAERKALTLKILFENMPIYIGERELIVGTRTFYNPLPGNEDGHDLFAYDLSTHIPYLTTAEKELFGLDQSYRNRTHMTPDFSIVLDKGIDGIINDAIARKNDPTLNAINTDFLSGVITAYRGLKTMILRYAQKATELASNADPERREELCQIARICNKVSGQRPDTFREAVQLLWFAHLGTIIESFRFINYGRLDVILGKYLGNTPMDEAQEIIECLLLKMYDQVDLTITYLGKYQAQLVVTLGGVLANGESAVNDVTMLFLKAIDKTRLPEPEFNLRINSKNPPEFLDLAAKLTVSGCNFVAYFNDDLFIDNLVKAGLSVEDAREYGFDLCQDMNIPGKGDFWIVGSQSLVTSLMELLKQRRNFESFDALLSAFKEYMAEKIRKMVTKYQSDEEHLDLYAQGRLDEYFEQIRVDKKPPDRNWNTPMAPLPLLSALYHGSIERALDIAFEPYPIKEKGVFFGSSVELVNSLAAIKSTVYEKRLYTLDEVYSACERNFDGERERIIRAVLWNCPKWGNDDDYVDLIAKDILEFCLREVERYKTYFGGNVLGGIHQPHPVSTGEGIMATPDGRYSGAPVAVTLTPQSGTVKNGPTAVLRSATKLDTTLIQWNCCVQINYFTSVFRGNGGAEIFKTLLLGYFDDGGLQHQPNLADVEQMKKAQLEPEKYKDLIVRLWGVSAHFVDLPKELQDEMIARFS